ncbi:plexin-B3-like [Mytilus galloprovincialis]|uniref:plexin-B3-like n=1 Tax=Mytilus galloprovincialis TaxID=29158 RepID=UPI003F7CA9E6
MTLLNVIIDDLTILTLNGTFEYLADPTFDNSNKSHKVQQSGGATFTIHGEGFNNVGEITVERVDKPCDVPTDNSAVCETPPKLKNQPDSQTIIVKFDGLILPVTIEYVDDPTFKKFEGLYEYDKESAIQIKVNVGNIKMYIGDLQYKVDVNILGITVVFLAAALVTTVVIGMLAVIVLKKKKKKAIKEFKMELITREEMIRKASREEFADAQMNIRDIKSDLVTARVPFLDYQTYILHLLFPNQDNILVHCLLEDMIRSSTKKQQKVLFRRFDSIVLRLMVNWLQIGLFRHLTSHSGMQLFMLYKAVQTITEMGPIDALTGSSKNTIAEEKLLKMRIEHQNLTLQIDLNGNSDQHYPVKVLDCDTISQVKQKCCAQIYKNKPASEIPHNDELYLEWQEGSAGKLTLNDIDNTSEKNNGLVCLNTLKHYMVNNNSKMALMYKPHVEEDVYVNSQGFRTESVTSEDISLLVADNGEGEVVEIQKWHLVY